MRRLVPQPQVDLVRRLWVALEPLPRPRRSLALRLLREEALDSKWVQPQLAEDLVAPAAAFAPSMGAFLDQAVARMNGAPLESIPEEGPAKGSGKGQTLGC